MNHNDYVLMTAAHDEERNIEGAIQSVLVQTERPIRWVIVSDSSTDKTDQIIKSYAAKYSWIKYRRADRQLGRNFASKIMALQLADQVLRGEQFSLIGNLDADVTLDPGYFAGLLDQFRKDSSLGVASGFVYEESAGRYVSRPLNSDQSVPHAAQLMRRACYESIGGYAVLKYGGEDWHALVSARMKGWRAVAFPDLRILHHRHSGVGSGVIRGSFRAGRMDYSFGSYPPFELLKCLRRLPTAHFTGGVVRMCGFLVGYLLREKRLVSAEFVKFLRDEQRERVSAFVRRCLRLRKNREVYKCLIAP